MEVWLNADDLCQCPNADVERRVGMGSYEGDRFDEREEGAAGGTPRAQVSFRAEAFREHKDFLPT